MRMYVIYYDAHVCWHVPGTQPTYRRIKTHDADRDGLTDMEEYEWVTDPNNPDTDGGGGSGEEEY